MRVLTSVCHVPAVSDGVRRSTPTHRRAPVRCFSKRRNKKDKIEADLVADLFDFALVDLGDLFTITENKKSTSKSKTRRKKKKAKYDSMESGFFEDSWDQVLDQMIHASFEDVDQQPTDTQQQCKDVYDIASVRVQNSSKIQQALGSVRCDSPFSKSSSIEYVDGAAMKRTKLKFKIAGEMGSGVVDVNAREDPQSVQKIGVKVRLESGRVIRVEDSNHETGGRAIDVEWKEV